ncbi:MAG: hypothetical protein MOB07_26850 [Acidobacteria bacterium]|nr:hypothetical protein [Acidobacteriota bacterium]
MPIRQVPNTDHKYFLIIYDADGEERAAGDGSKLSQVVIDELKTGKHTDIFVMSHGWMGDIPAAENQYDRWMSNLMGCADDISRAQQSRPGFKPLLIGLHWPSLPWGEEDTGGSFSLDPTADPDEPSEEIRAAVASAVEDFATRLGDAPGIRRSLETILTAYAVNAKPDSLPENVQQAYLTLNDALSFGSGSPGTDPDADRESFDPEQIFQDAIGLDQKDAANTDAMFSFGSFSKIGNLMAPLRTLSFWRMKNRARSFGESGANRLLRALQQAAAGHEARIHLMGHSFGCIVITAMAAGPPGNSGPQAPVHSLFLVQGALSLWAYCPDIPHDPGNPGYFHPLIKNKRVSGPIITTRSSHDYAVGKYYPLGAGVAGQVSFDLFPKYGGIGTHGIQGLEDLLEDLPMKKMDETYSFQRGRIYNLESSHVVEEKQGSSGAHSDIAHPEVAHAWWQAVIVE